MNFAILSVHSIGVGQTNKQLSADEAYYYTTLWYGPGDIKGRCQNSVSLKKYTSQLGTITLAIS